MSDIVSYLIGEFMPINDNGYITDVIDSYLEKNNKNISGNDREGMETLLEETLENLKNIRFSKTTGFFTIHRKYFSKIIPEIAMIECDLNGRLTSTNCDFSTISDEDIKDFFNEFEIYSSNTKQKDSMSLRLCFWTVDVYITVTFNKFVAINTKYNKEKLKNEQSLMPFLKTKNEFMRKKLGKIPLYSAIYLAMQKFQLLMGEKFVDVFLQITNIHEGNDYA